MSKLTVENFRAGATRLAGEVIETLYQRRQFTVRVLEAERGVEYLPLSSGKPREQRWNYVERVLERFNECGSMHPADYTDITKHSSYVLAIVKRMREPRGASTYGGV